MQRSLSDLADLLIEAADRKGLTPVLVTDSSLVLRREFYGALIRYLVEASERSLRFEVLAIETRRPRLLNDWSANRLRRQLQTSIPVGVQDRVSVEQRLILSRPSGPLRPLAVGFVGSMPMNHIVTQLSGLLPVWATPVHLTARPTASDQIQLAAA